MQDIADSIEEIEEFIRAVDGSEGELPMDGFEDKKDDDDDDENPFKHGNRDVGPSAGAEGGEEAVAGFDGSLVGEKDPLV